MALSTVNLFKKLKLNDCCIELSECDRKALQKVLVGVLGDIAKLCDKHGIEWCVSGGICLGAVRHKGFIPWDDDLDIFLQRKDLARFEAAVRSDMPQKYEIRIPSTANDYAIGIARLLLKGTTLRGQNDFTDDCGVFCDIFILEDVPENSVLRTLHGIGSLGLGLAQSCRRFSEHSEQYKAVVKGNREAERSVKQKVFIGNLFAFRDADTWTRSWDKWNARFPDNESSRISCPAGRNHYFGEMYRREDFFPVSYGEFEGLRVPLPANPDAYLTALYGPDYMTPPAEIDREAHVVLEFDLGKYDPRNEKPEDCG